MLCSVPAGKAGPNWLDRLRSNKGFPIAHNLGLDHFLTNQSLVDNPDSTPTNHRHHSDSVPNSSISPTPTPTPTHNEIPGSCGIITGILSDLFNMTGASSLNSTSSPKYKKFPRKQSNPKICSIPSLDNADYADDKNLCFCCAQKEHNILSSNSDNSSKGRNAKHNVVGGSDKAQNARGKVEEEELEDEKGDKELIGFSKSEVTVIDTSSDVWKSEKLIFRRKNVWKVKDKKGKLRSYGRKKRKHSSETNDLSHLIASPSKKTKIWSPEQRLHFNAQHIRGKESLKPLNQGHNSQHCSGPGISANAPDSGNDKKESVYTVSPENGSYDPQ